jgi:hypothetical protein
VYHRLVVRALLFGLCSLGLAGCGEPFEAGMAYVDATTPHVITGVVTF